MAQAEMLFLTQIDRRATICPLPSTPKHSFSAALDAISVTTELVEEELQPHLETLLTAAVESKKDLSVQVVKSGTLPVLAQALRSKNSITLHTARLVAELAREDLQQHRLLRMGAVSRLVAVLLQYCKNEALLSSCLSAMCNLADMGEEDSSTNVWEKKGSFEKEGHGISKHSFSFVSTVTVVHLNQRSQGQYSVTVEELPRHSTLFCGQCNRHDADRHLLRFRGLGCFPKFYKIIKHSVENVPKNRGIKSAVFYTFL